MIESSSLFTNLLWWYLILGFLGVVFFPLTRKIFGNYFYDFGFPISKVIGILFLSFSVFVLGLARILPFSFESIALLLTLFAGINFFIFKKDQDKGRFKIDKRRVFLIICEEIAFFTALYLWVFIRGQEPSIRGLEKFMDFGFINSILRSSYFPPADMWLSGYSINYYYFGHLTGAVLTKLSRIPSVISYNLILATIFALGIVQTFSLVFNIVYNSFSKNLKLSLVGGILASFLLNFAGNLHTIYLFTKSYPNEQPVPFWQIMSTFTPDKYWYPNATRFIPFTIHEFPIYSYVVADLHGHVFDIPFVLLTLAVLLIFFLRHTVSTKKILNSKFLILNSIFLGFLSAVHYMTNAFDGPIYLMLTIIIFYILFRRSKNFFTSSFVLLLSFFIFIMPFSINFSPFATGIGVNCAPNFLVAIKKFGPFLFEKGNCQISPPWMLFILWGFFWTNFIFLLIKVLKKDSYNAATNFILALFLLSSFLLVIPEFFYIKDIYPGHFRANTMFKLGYQAFMMMTIASSYVFILYRATFKRNLSSILYFAVFIIIFSLVALYPFFAITSYYGKLDKKPGLDGAAWIKDQYKEYEGIIDFFNSKVADQPTILEAQGDSYTDFNVVSSYTGLPTVAGWYVHQWLWRGNPEVAGKRVVDIQNIYESSDLALTKTLLKKFNIKYVVIGQNERKKYTNLNEEKFNSIGKLVYSSTGDIGKIFSVNETNTP